MDLTRTGYRPNPETIQALKSLMAQKGSGARALLVTGEAGTGKTALAEAIADALDARDRYYYVQLHSWTDGKKFFDYQSGAGDEEKGFLTKVAEACVFHMKSATDSTANQPPVPPQTGHPFHGNPAT